jgi:hypothetical protein
MRNILGPLLVVTALSISSPAFAANYWSSPAAGCVPGDPAIQNNRYSIQAGHVYHAGTNIDLISFYCPVQYNPGATAGANTLFLTFIDNSTTAGNYVTAQLIKMDRSNGSLTTVATVTSEDWDPNASVQQQSIGFSDSLDFTTYVFYVRVDMDRSSTSILPVFYATSLDDVSP